MDHLDPDSAVLDKKKLLVDNISLTSVLWINRTISLTISLHHWLKQDF